MESHSCEKTRGEGVETPLGRAKVYPQDELLRGDKVAVSVPSSNLEALPHDDLDRCRHIDAQGRRCRMFVAPAEKALGSGPDSDLADLTADLCAHHAQQILRRHRAGQTVAAELLASVNDFSDAASVNRFLGNLMKMVALRRIPRRDAVVMAYISQLLLNSQSAQDRGELLRYQLELLQKKNAPFRLIWDLPRRHEDADAGADSKPAENPAANPGVTNTGQ